MNDNRHSWPAQLVKDLLVAGLADNSYSARGMLGKSEVITPSTDRPVALAWAGIYRHGRDNGLEPGEAARKADAAILATVAGSGGIKQ